MPTKPEQSDLQMLALGANGDFPRIVLAPTGPADAFTLAVDAVNLSQDLQCPVYLALDQAIAQNAETIDAFDLETVVVSDGKRIDTADLDGAYRRYEFTDDGVSPWAIPGDPGGVSLITGNEHDAWGHVSTDPANRTAMIEKRAHKLASATDRLPSGRSFGDPDAAVGVLGVGMEAGALVEAAEHLARRGLAVAGLLPRTVWPIADDTRRFLASRERTYVVEHDAGGQLCGLLRHGGIAGDRLHSVLRFDGVPFGPRELADRIMELEAT